MGCRVSFATNATVVQTQFTRISIGGQESNAHLHSTAQLGRHESLLAVGPGVLVWSVRDSC